MTARIGVNLTWLQPGVVGGSEEFTVRLLQAFYDHQSTDLGRDGFKLCLYGSQELFDTYPDLVERFATKSPPAWVMAGKAGRVGAENSWLASVTRNDDLVHHAGGVVPLIRSAPSVVTIFDLQPVVMPENFGAVKRCWLNTMLPYSARAARLVICPSRFTADAIVERFGVSPSAVRVISQGYVRRSGPSRPTNEQLNQQMIDRFGRFCLYPAIAYPHKRHRDLVVAFGLLSPELGDVSLVFTGRPGPETESLKTQVARAGLTSKIHFVGRVPTDELEALYNSAKAVVFCSEFEGFGNPVLEAMSHGVPVITSDAPALVEVSAGAAVVVPARSPAGLAEAITDLLVKPDTAEALVEAGHRRVKQFLSVDSGKNLAAAYADAFQVYPEPNHSAERLG